MPVFRLLHSTGALACLTVAAVARLVERSQVPWGLIAPGCIAGCGAVVANMVYLTMIDKINEKSPESERISYFSGGVEVRRRFKELYPADKLIRVLDSCLLVTLLCCILGIKFWVFA